MPTITLSDAAVDLLERRRDGERIPVDERTRPAYRELADAGLMIPLHTLTGGDESAYRLTEAGVTYPSRPASSEASPARAR
jgi:hypothetical protein